MPSCIGNGDDMIDVELEKMFGEFQNSWPKFAKISGLYTMKGIWIYIRIMGTDNKQLPTGPCQGELTSPCSTVSNVRLDH